MGKKKVWSACLALCILLCSGCSDSNKLKLSDLDADTLYVSSDGTMELANVEEFKEEYYSKSELKEFIQDTIDTYAEQGNQGTVKMEDFAVKDEVAKVLLSFDSPDTYTAFQGEELQLLKSEEITDNLVLPQQFSTLEDGKKIDKQKVLEQKGLNYIIVNSSLNIHLDGNVKYYSDAMIIGDDEIQTTGEKPAVIIFE